MDDGTVRQEEASGAGGDRACLVRQPASPFEQVRRCLMEDDRVGAALALERITTELGLRELHGRAVVALAKTRRVESERRVGTISRDEAEAARASIVLTLDGLIADAEEEAHRRAAACPAPTRAAPRAPPSSTPGPERGVMLACERVVKRYGARFTLGPVSLSLGHGEILGVVGANGSGKTSLLRILVGELAPDRGTRAVSFRDAGERPLAVPAMLVPESPPSWTGRMEQHLSWQAALFGHRTPEDNALGVTSMGRGRRRASRCPCAS